MAILEECDVEEGSERGHSMPVHSEIEGETTKSDPSRKKLCTFLIVLAVLLVFTTIGLVVGLLLKPGAPAEVAASKGTLPSSFDQGVPDSTDTAAVEPNPNNNNEGNKDEEATSPEEGKEKEEVGVIPVQEEEETQTTNPPDDYEPTPIYPIHTTEPKETTEEEDPDPMPFYPVDTSHRLGAIIEFLADEGISEKSEMETSGTYANKAVEWLADEDLMSLPIPSLIHPNSTSVTKDHFITRYVLAHLFFATGGSKWERGLNFLSDKPTCEWYAVVESLPVGVGCDENDEVVAIFLNNNKLQNQLPSTLGYFSNLVMIDLDVNFLTGSLPDSFAALTNLEHMHLGSNGLGGSLPSWIGGLTSLGSLNIGFNSFVGSLPSELSSLPALRELALDHNVFQGDVNALFGSSISGLKFLEELFLDSNTFMGSLSADFAADMPHLKQLDLSDNAFNGQIPSHLFSLEKLEVLDIHDNLFASMPENFEANSALKFFAAHKNVIAGAIPDTIVNLVGLTHLDLSQNQLQGPISEAFGDTLANLTYLFLADNNFEPGPIPLSVSNLASLKELSLKSTQRTGVIPETLGLLTDLVFLDLDNNALSGAIPESMGSLTNLKLLLLNRNKLENDIPADFSQLTQLEVFFIEGNSILGGLDSICDMVSEDNQIEIVAQCSLCEPITGCCTKCCQDGDECNDKTKVASLDPIWQLSYERFEYSLGGL